MKDTINNETCRALHIGGGTQKSYTVSKDLQFSGKKGEIYNLGGWFKGDIVLSKSDSFLYQIEPETTNYLFNRKAQMELTYEYFNENGEYAGVETIVVPFRESLNYWQFNNKAFELKGDCYEMNIRVVYENLPNPAFFAYPELTLNSNAIARSEESSATCACGDKCKAIGKCECACASPEVCTCDSCKECTCEGCETLLCKCRCASEEECNCISCKKKSISTYDDKGNLLTSGYSNGTNSFISLCSYTPDGNYMSNYTDENGNATKYSYNTDNGVLDKVTDGSGNDIKYAYDAMNFLNMVSADASNLAANATELATWYNYSGDKLTEIYHNGTNLIISYDPWGQIKTIGTKAQTLVTYTYGIGANRDRVEKITFGNGQNIPLGYDESGKVTTIKFDEIDKYVYKYDDLGNVSELVDLVLNRKIKICEDRIEIFETTSDTATGENTDKLVYKSYINENGDSVELIGDVEYTTKRYNGEYSETTGISAEKSVVTASNGKTIGSASYTDSLGRPLESIVMTKDPTVQAEEPFAAVKTSFVYPTYEDGKTSSQIMSFSNTVTNGLTVEGDDIKEEISFSYEYDKNGRITAEYSGNDADRTLEHRYEYDEAGQLVRFDDASAGKSYTYTYDGGGNIRAKSEYPFSTAELGTATKTIAYTYDSFLWRDKLMSYNGKPVTYDAIGNPLSYDGATMTWDGRELKSYEKGEQKIEFSYNESGLRHKKSVYKNGLLTDTYDYIWSSSGQLAVRVHTSYSGDTPKVSSAKYIYNSFGDIEGFVINDSQTYLYIKNVQGDIAAIADSAGNVVVRYDYDTWGVRRAALNIINNPNAPQAIMANYHNPFGYRGYLWDSEMGLYYLQSRYYSPEWGRFLNADDPSIPIQQQGTVLSANLFAYCTNDPVNNTDANGYWKKEAHKEWTKKWLAEFSSGMINNTYIEWIAQGTYDMDEKYPPFPTKDGTLFDWFFNQQYHFNRKYIFETSEDTRLLGYEEFFNRAVKLWNNGNTKEAMKTLGMAVHCLQDMPAHGNIGYGMHIAAHLPIADDERFEWISPLQISLYYSPSTKSRDGKRKSQTKFLTFIGVVAFLQYVHIV